MLHRLLLLSLLLTAAALAQRPSAFTQQTLSGPYAAGFANQLGKVLTYQDGGTLWAYSAFTRRFESLPYSGGGTLRMSNDWAVVQDGLRLHAFSSYRGRFETITTGPTAYIWNPASQRNDSILVVVDGAELLTFSGFTGRWRRAPLSGNAQIATQRHTLLVAEGTTLRGMSAFDGIFVSTTTQGPVLQLATEGIVGTAETATMVYGFSAQQRWFRMAAALPGPTQRLDASDLTLWHDGISALGFSGLTGTFTTAVTGPATSLQVDDGVAIVQGTLQSHLYSSARGTWLAVPVGSSGSIRMRTHTILLEEPAAIHAYSGLRGDLATLAGVVTQSGVNNTAAAVVLATGAQHLYSAFTGAWQPLPANALPGQLPQLTWNGALCATSTGFAAFSARFGAFTPLATAPGALVYADDPSAVMAVLDGATLHIFEPRRQAWLTQTFQQVPAVRVWRTTLLAHDGTTAAGYGALSGELSTMTLPGPVSEVQVNSESARIAVGDRLYGYAASADFTPHAQFPEFRRLYGVGSPLEMVASGPAGALAAAYLSLGLTAPIPLPFGEVLLDPALMVVLPLAALDAEGLSRLGFVVPDLALPPGLQLYLQALVVPSPGVPYLTPLVSVSVF